MHEQFAILNQTRGKPLAHHLEQATTWWRRARGLLGRRELPIGHALLIEPCNSVHCFFMAFPIDVIYIDRRQRVVALAPNLKPNHIGPIALRARAVIELPAGVIEQTATQIGDQLVIA